jgi:uncharacterized protein DUF3105
VSFRRKLVSAALVGVLAVSACGGGSAPPPPPDIPGVVVERAAGRNHGLGHIDYPGKKPPSGGDHNPLPLTCGAYDQQPPDENAVHSLEHGAVWIAFDSSIPAPAAAVLKAFAKEDHVLVTPYAGMSAPITVVAWGHRLELQSASDPRLKQFVEEFRNASTAPEHGAKCVGIGQPLR